VSDDPTRREPLPEPPRNLEAVGEPRPTDTDPLSVDEASDEAPPPPVKRRRRRWPLVAVAVVAVAAVAAVNLRPSPAPIETPPPSPTATPKIVLPVDPTAGLLATPDDVRQRVALAQAGAAPFADALTALLGDAEGFLGEPPQPKEPLDIKGTDGPFVEDSSRAYGLALAWVATGDRRYATAAADLIRAWSTTTKTTRHTCPAGGDCQTSLIIGRTAPGFVFAADLLDGSGALSEQDTAVFDQWLRDVILPTASVRDNNWGDAGTFARLAISSHLDDGNEFDAAVQRWRAMMDLVAADGHIPEEVRRGEDGITYTQEAIQYKVGSAVLAARRGVDLWSYQGANGATLKTAVDYLVGFADTGAQWPWDARAQFPTPGPLWELIHAHWPEPRYEALVMTGRPFGDDGHSAIRWTTITSAGPLPGGSSSASPSTALASHSASPTPSATPTAEPATPAPTDDPAAALAPPVVMLRAGAYPDLDHLPVRVDWDGIETDDVRRYELQRMDDGHRTERVLVDDGERTRHDEYVPTGSDLSWRLRVSRRGHGTSDWVTTDARLARSEEDAAGIRYDGRWSQAQSAGYTGRGVRWSSTRGSTVTVDFTGSGIAWLGPIGPTRGRATMTLDGKDVGGADLRTSTFHARWVIFTADAGGSGTHTLQIRVADGSGPVAVDSFVVLRP
jgi:hypothetical protein